MRGHLESAAGEVKEKVGRAKLTAQSLWPQASVNIIGDHWHWISSSRL